jgi:hypothetical protein
VSIIRYRIRKALNRITGHRVVDDAYWHDSTDHYRGELRENEKHHTLQIAPGDFAFVDGVLQPAKYLSEPLPSARNQLRLNPMRRPVVRRFVVQSTRRVAAYVVCR